MVLQNKFQYSNVRQIPKHVYCIVSSTNRYIFITTEKMFYSFLWFSFGRCSNTTATFMNKWNHMFNIHRIMCSAFIVVLFYFTRECCFASSSCAAVVNVCLPHILLVFTSSGHFRVIYWLINGSTRPNGFSLTVDDILAWVFENNNCIGTVYCMKRWSFLFLCNISIIAWNIWEELFLSVFGFCSAIDLTFW